MIAFLLFLVFIGLCAVIVLLLRKSADPTLLEWVKTTQEEIRQLQQTVVDHSSRSSRDISESMREQTREIHDRLSRASDVIGELKREAGAFTEMSRSMKELNEFLKSPKLRGNIGEEVLNDLISQMFPKQKFFIQHRFRTGSIVDAAIQTDAGILAIDSKFPMEHFQMMINGETENERSQAQSAFSRDVKRHIDDVSFKYILPSEGTMDFALMYVPSETVYYEIINDNSLLEYSRRKHVYLVSPTTLYAHLQMILLSFRGKEIQEKTKEIYALLRSIEQSYTQLDQGYQTLGRHLTNAYNNYNQTAQMLGRLGQHVEQTKRIADTPEEFPLPSVDNTTEV